MSSTTFLVTARGGTGVTAKCLASVRRYFPDAPLLVTDDGSEEHDAHALVSLTDKAGATLLRLRHGGKSVALNLAARLVETEFVTLLDNDVILHGADWLAEHHAALTEERVGAVGGYGNPDFGDTWGGLYLGGIETWMQPGYCEMVNGGLVTTRTALLRDVPHDERFFCDYEEYAWALRLKERGLILFLSPAPCIHLMGTQQPSDERQGRTETARALFLEHYRHLVHGDISPERVNFFRHTGRWPARDVWGHNILDESGKEWTWD